MDSKYIKLYFLIILVINILAFIYVYKFMIKGEKIKNERILYGPTAEIS